MEAPEVWFFDVLTFDLPSERVGIDPTWLAVIEPGTLVIAAQSLESLQPVVARLREGGIDIITDGPVSRQKMTVVLAGIRRGMNGRRFEPKTAQQMAHNNAFWAAARLK